LLPCALLPEAIFSDRTLHPTNQMVRKKLHTFVYQAHILNALLDNETVTVSQINCSKDSASITTRAKNSEKQLRM
jgi:hypothetical protein